MTKEIRLQIKEEIYNRIVAQADQYGQRITSWVLQATMEKVVSLEKAEISRKSLTILENLQKMELEPKL